MRIPADAIIPSAKLTDYLLAYRRRSDKSRYLGQVGFSVEQPVILEMALRRLIAEYDATSDQINEYGVFFVVQGDLRGPNGILRVATICMQRKVDDRFVFVTLKPWR